jgi:hypothetical protein
MNSAGIPLSPAANSSKCCSPESAGKKGNYSQKEAQKTIQQLLNALCNMQRSMGQKFRRKAKHLSSRWKEDESNTMSDPVVHRTESEMVETWFAEAHQFESWMDSVSKAGIDFEGLVTEKLDCIPQLIAAIQLLLNWEDNAADHWQFNSEGFLVSLLLSSCAGQKYYLDRILAPSGPLYGYVSLLLKWTEWAASPEHPSRRSFPLLLTGLLTGVVVSKREYDAPVDPALLEPLLPAFQQLIQTIHEDPELWTPLNHSSTVDPVETFRNATTRMRICLMTKEVFPALDLSPIAPLARYLLDEQKKRIDAVWATDAELQDGVSVLTEVLAACKVTKERSSSCSGEDEGGK